MVSPSRGKAVDKQELCKKLLNQLRKHYTTDPKPELPVLETMLYGICLEDATPVQAEQAYARMLNGFHDLNEVRVSSIYELQSVFEGMVEPEWKALRLRSALQYVFESTYSFDFDILKRKTSEQAAKIISKINSLSGFVRSFITQNALGAHVLPIDRRMHAALVWLGLSEPKSSPDHDGETLRSFVRKADAQLFCHMLRCLSTDPKYLPVFHNEAGQLEISPEETLHRLDVLFKQGPAAAKKLDASRLASQAKQIAAEKAIADKAAEDTRIAAAAKKKAAEEKAVREKEREKEKAAKERAAEKQARAEKSDKPSRAAETTKKILVKADQKKPAVHRAASSSAAPSGSSKSNAARKPIGKPAKPAAKKGK